MARAALCIASLCFVASPMGSAVSFLEGRANTVASESTNINVIARHRPQNRENLIATFRKTGCQNRHPSNDKLSWWRRQPQDVVLKDMYLICKANKEGCSQIGKDMCSECCGARFAGCSHVGCVKQAAYSRR